MGMFDYVEIQCPLPDAEAAEVTEWQTKSFDSPYLERYRLTGEGRLVKQRVHYEDRSDPNAPGLMRFAGMCTPVPDGPWDDVAFGGCFSFCGVTPANEWFKYDALFKGGALVNIVRVARGSSLPKPQEQP